MQHGIETRVGRPVYVLAHRVFWQEPVSATLSSRLGAVEASHDNACRLLGEDRAAVLDFPEGDRGTGKPITRRYRLAPFGRGGFADVAIRTGAPIVPLAIVGAEETMPVIASSRRLARRLGVPNVALTLNTMILGTHAGWLPAKFRIRVLEPVQLSDGPRPHPDRNEVVTAAEDIRHRIQDSLYDMLRRRRSIWH